jgi:TrkA-N domain/RyR domain
MPAVSSPAARVETPPSGPLMRALRAWRLIWRRQIKGRWQNLRPLILLGLGLSALVLGTIGYLQLTSVTPRYGFLDALYRSIALFAFGGTAPPPIPPALQIARIIAPILTGYAVIGTVLTLAREQFRVLLIRLFLRKHVIIAGLGETGSRLALALVDYEPVVVIESDPSNERHPAARLHGVWVLVGQATDEALLRRAGLRYARSLVISCGTDGTNVDVAAAATRALSAGTRPLTIFAHLRDLDLWSSLAAEGATFSAQRPGLRLEYFNVLATGAQLLLEHHPPFPTRPLTTAPWRPHILMVGVQGVGEQLALQIARLWGPPKPESHDQLRITLTGPDADAELADLRARYPAIERYCKLRARQMELESASFQAGAAMIGSDGTCDVTHAYVSLADEGDALLAALALHGRPDTTSVPVTIAVADADAGIAILTASNHGRFAGITAFGALSAATSHELLLRGTNELLARAQHAQWMRNERAMPTTAPDNPHLKPWERLGEEQREDNRKFADDLHEKLTMVHCMLVPNPLPDPDDQPFSFDPADLELLARHEHERWMHARIAAGWRYGEPRNDALKIHDQLKPWEQLDEPNRDKDRNAVREIPGMLALAGFRIQKTDESPKGA